VGLGYVYADDGTRLQLAASAALSRNRVADVFGEVGLVPRRSDDVGYRLTGRTALEVSLAEGVGAAVAARYARDGFSPDDALVVESLPGSRRDAGQLRGELRFGGSTGGARIEVRPSLQLDVSHSSLNDPLRETTDAEREAAHALLSARLGAVVEPVRGLALAASVGRAARQPTFVELFGDRGFVIGNTALEPEQSVSADVGATLAGSEGIVSGAIELRGFALFLDRLIRYVRNSQYQAIAENADDGRVLGLELGVNGRIGRHLALALAVTAIDPTSDGRTLPLRPMLTGILRPALEVGIVTAYVEVLHVGSSFADAANLVRIEGRTHLSAGGRLALLDERLAAHAAVRDVLDARGVDVLGFPLPGRSAELGLAWEDRF
jgi:iron complex outermembrane receptor protein